MMPPDHDQDKPHDSETQAAAANNQKRRASRRRWIKAAGLAAVPLIVTVKAQPVFAGPGPGAATKKHSGYPGKK